MSGSFHDVKVCWPRQVEVTYRRSRSTCPSGLEGLVVVCSRLRLLFAFVLLLVRGRCGGRGGGGYGTIEYWVLSSCPSEVSPGEVDVHIVPRGGILK